MQNARSFRNIRTLPRKQGGQMSIEYAIVIGLIAIALAGIAWYAFSGRTKMKINDATSSITTMLNGVQSLYSRDPNGYANLTTQVVIDNKIVPKNLLQGSTVTNEFNGTVDFTPTTLNGVANAGIQIDYDKLDTDACSGVVAGVESWFQTITVGGTVVKDLTAATPKTFSQADLGTGCNSNSGGPVDVVFVAGR